MGEPIFVPKEQKQVLAKSLLDLNYSATKIAEILRIGRATVYRYAETPTPDDLRQFETELRTMIYAKQAEILAKVLMSIEDSLDISKLSELVAAYTAVSKNIFTPQISLPADMSLDFVVNSPDGKPINIV